MPTKLDVNDKICLFVLCVDWPFNTDNISNGPSCFFIYFKTYQVTKDKSIKIQPNGKVSYKTKVRCFIAFFHHYCESIQFKGRLLEVLCCAHVHTCTWLMRYTFLPQVSGYPTDWQFAKAVSNYWKLVNNGCKQCTIQNIKTNILWRSQCIQNVSCTSRIHIMHFGEKHTT